MLYIYVYIISLFNPEYLKVPLLRPPCAPRVAFLSPAIALWVARSGRDDLVGMKIDVKTKVLSYKIVDLPIEHGDFPSFFVCYTLWFLRLHSELERSTMLLMGKLTISMAILNSFLYVYQRVSRRT